MSRLWTGIVFCHRRKRKKSLTGPHNTQDRVDGGFF
jgi:hypothetical protein